GAGWELHQPHEGVQRGLGEHRDYREPCVLELRLDLLDVEERGDREAVLAEEPRLTRSACQLGEQAGVDIDLQLLLQVPAVEAQKAGQLAHRRQLGAGFEGAPADLLLQLLAELDRNREVARRVDGDAHWPSSLGQYLPLFQDRFSPAPDLKSSERVGECVQERRQLSTSMVMKSGAGSTQPYWTGVSLTRRFFA